MMVWKTLIFISVLFTISCSTPNYSNLAGYKKIYSFKDLSGEFNLQVESGRKENEFFFKKILMGVTDQKEYEKSIAISRIKEMKSPRSSRGVMIPVVSQYTVWLDKQKYFSQIKVHGKKRVIELLMKSPEKKWNGKKEFKIPEMKGAYCFFSQVVDCLRVTGYFSQSVKKNKGRFNFTLIWDGYPYVNDQYAGLSPELFSNAYFIYEGPTAEGLHKFSLNFGTQIIFFQLNEKMQLRKKFWVSEGLSQVER